MALDDHQSSMPNDADDPLSYNPFASDGDLGSSSTAHQDPSFLTKHRYTAPSTRGRVSSGSGRGVSTTNGWHSRTHSEAQTSSGRGSHPLKSAGDTDAGITRPHLSRIVSVGTLVDVSPINRSRSHGSDKSGSSKAEDKEVLVHEVTSKDSLAGVSLRYGIPIAELRRANQLWASDSIHLRKALYIPIEKASRVGELSDNSDLINISPGSDEHELPDPFELAGKADGAITSQERASAPNSLLPNSTGTVRRVPASQLSFFPPPAPNKLSPQSIPPAPNRVEHHPYFVNKYLTTHSRLASSPSHSLTSFLTALPIAASTRDTIIARLSYDSTSSSYSDRDREDDHSEGHELDDVKPTMTSGHPLLIDHPENIADVNETLPVHSPTTPKARHHIPQGWVTTSTILPSPPPSPTRQRTPHHHRHTISEDPYMSSEPYIRTVQMEPSPSMQLPPLRTSPTHLKGKGKARRSVMDMDFELAGTDS